MNFVKRKVGAWPSTLKISTKCLCRGSPNVDPKCLCCGSPNVDPTFSSIRPAHVIAVTCITEILFIVTLGDQYSFTHFYSYIICDSLIFSEGINNKNYKNQTHEHETRDNVQKVICMYETHAFYCTYIWHSPGTMSRMS